MDMRQTRYATVAVTGVAEAPRLTGSMIELLQQMAVLLRASRAGDVTIRISTSSERLEATGGSPAALATPAGEVLVAPDPLLDEDYESYCERLERLGFGEVMSVWHANEAFARVQVAWAGDSRAARFIHMNASSRQFERADPSEYAALSRYVEDTYPALFSGLTLRG